MRTTRAVDKAERSPRLKPAMPPPMRRRRRNAEGGSRRPQRQTTLDRRDQRTTARQSELGVSVQIHSGPPWLESLARPRASKEGRMYLSAVHNLCAVHN